ncbi:MAG: hypothetical protein V3U96_07750 [Paracoccaceae bacterium]
MKHILMIPLLLAFPAYADAPVVKDVGLSQSGTSWTISVTLSHPDTGWDHYADGWEVLDADGNSLGIRVLGHPHVNEQPFTRSLGSVDIPSGTAFISIRARDNIDGWFDGLFRVDLPG